MRRARSDAVARSVLLSHHHGIWPLFLFVTLLPSISGAMAAKTMPLENGGFEDGLRGWWVEPAPKDAGQVQIVTGDVLSGRCAVRMTSGPKAKRGEVAFGQKGYAPLPFNCRAFAVTAWLKIIQPPRSIGLRISATDKNGAQLAPWDKHGWQYPVITPDPVGVWYRTRSEFVARRDWGGFQLKVQIAGEGADVLVDDIAVETVEPAEWMIESVGCRLPEPKAGVALWWEGPLRKVFPNEGPPRQKGARIQLSAAGGEFETVQVCVRPEQPLENAKVEFTDLVGPERLPASVLKANFVGFVNVKHPSRARSMPGFTPDPLLPDESITIPAGRTTPIWVTLRVPSSTKRGQYSGTMTLHADGLDASVPMSVRVYGFDLPKHPRLKTKAQVAWRNWCDLDPQFQRNLQEHRCCGKGETSNRQFAGIAAKRVGDAVVVDSSKLKEMADTYVRGCGLDVFWVPHVMFGGSAGLSEASKKWFGFETFSPEFDRAFEGYCKQVGDALRAEGILRYALWQIWDEPNPPWIEKCAHLARLIKRAVPDARVYLTRWPMDELLDLVDIWCVPMPGYYSVKSAAKGRAHGAAIWMYENSLYTLDVPDSSLLMRYYPWRLRLHDVEGVEWWQIDDWQRDPWTAPWSGDGCLLYPAKDRKNSPIDSIRWELCREGVEDYDILSMLAEEQDRVLKALGVSDERLSGKQQMQQLAQRVALNAADVVHDPRAADDAKRQACERIEFLRQAPLAAVGTLQDKRGAMLLVAAESGARLSINGENVEGELISRRLGANRTAVVEVSKGGKSKCIAIVEPLPQERGSTTKRGRAEPEREPGYRFWTDSTGKYRVEAALDWVMLGMAKLLKKDGTDVLVPLERLSDEDQKWLGLAENKENAEKE